MIWRANKDGQLVFRPVERFAAGDIGTRLVGLILALRKTAQHSRRRQIQAVMSADDAKALVAALLLAIEESEGRPGGKLS